MTSQPADQPITAAVWAQRDPGERPGVDRCNLVAAELQCPRAVHAGRRVEGVDADAGQGIVAKVEGAAAQVEPLAARENQKVGRSRVNE